MRVLTDAFVVVDEHDFTGDSNQLRFDVSVEPLDATVFGSGGWKSFVGGRKTAKLDVDGFLSVAASGSVDQELLPDLGAVDRLVTFSPVAGVGELAYFGRMGKFATNLFGKVAELTPFSLSCSGSDPIGFVRGQVAAAKATAAATGVVGSALDLGAAAATQKLYCAVHVHSAGTTLTLELESSPDNTFAAPTLQATIGPLTAAGGTWLVPVAGPITDTWYRLNASAVTGSFTITAAIAIQ